ncbi:MAG TPA: GEVED domain-containing protein [Flavipsychrobacter sp.]|nr:GEVED domain-containing protein [Flavipsychrobacter sp.]
MLKDYNFRSSSLRKRFAPFLWSICILLLTVSNAKAQYCAAANTDPAASGSLMANVTFGSINNTTGSTYPTNGYSYWPALSASVIMGTSENLIITTAPAGTYTGAIISVWIDWNQDNTFSASEWLQVGTNITVATSPYTFPIPIPLTATPGTTRMRIRSRGNGNVNGSGDACTSFGSGETEDYNITVVPPTACAGTPVAGTTTATNTNICLGSSTILSLTGYTVASGISFQWETATSLSGPWSPEGSSQIAPSISVTPATAGTTYYRCNVSCGAATAVSNNMAITVPVPFAGGTYTVNSAVATGGTNFQSFTAAMTALNCGITGPITLNVVPGSGPYNEQVIVPNSFNATNTLIINGNGAIVQFNATTTYQGVLMIDGADYVKIDSLTFKALNATYGFGAILSNNCDFDSITRCTFDLTAVTSTSTANATGIRISATPSGTSTTASGATNTYIGNSKILCSTGSQGAYYALYSYGPSNNNVYHNNYISNFYYAGIYDVYSNNVTVSKNHITCQTKTGVANYVNGIYTSNATNGTKYINNRIEYLGGATANMGTFYSYPIYATTGAGTSAAPILIANNIVTNSTLSPIYGFYITGNYFDVYHNTINMEHLSGYTGTQQGIYSSSTTSNFKNNIISFTGGGTGAKYGLYYTSATVPASSNYNNVYVNSSQPGAQYFGYRGSNQATLAAFQAATTQEANGNNIDPIFVSGGVQPSNAAIDNIGTPIANVTEDFFGALRDLNTPDVGAIEFLVPPCGSPVAGTVSASATNVCLGRSFNVTLTGNNIGVGQTYQWESAPSLTGPWTPEGSANISPSNTITATVTGVTYYRCAVNCGASTVFSNTVSVNVPALYPGGTYTVNSGVATGGTNFQNFTDAIAAIGCGIAGPVVLNVVANSGPYTEQIILPKTLGTDAVKTLTINGNGATVQFNGTAPYQGILMMDSVAYVKIDSLTFKALNATYGFGAMLYNLCDHDSITRCTFDMTAVTSTSTANATGIRIASTAFGTSTTVSGATNTYIGGSKILCSTGNQGCYYGIYAYGPNNNNVYHKNYISNFYYAGIGDFYSNNVTVSNNHLTCQTKVGVINYVNGINTGNATNGSKYINNLIEYLGGATAQTGVYYSYPIYATGGAGSSTVPVLIANNVVTNSTLSPIYGFYITGSYYDVYHNTINIDQISGYTGTQYGIYTSSTTSKFQNNLVSFTKGGSGVKYGLYYTAATVPASSNYNNVYVNSTQPGAQYYGYRAVNYSTLAAFQSATSLEANGLAVDPVLVPVNGIPRPYSATMDNMGTPLASITEDFLGVLRNPSTPDIGAVEYTPPVCPPSGNLSASNVTAYTVDLNWLPGSTAALWQIEYGPAPLTLGTGTRTFATVNPHPLVSLTPSTNYQFYVRDVCGPGDTSIWSNAGSFTTACVPITSFPWTENFDALTTVGLTSFPLCWAKENGDWATSAATTYNTSYSPANHLRNSWSAVNEYMWTPGFDLVANTSYDFSFYVAGDGFTGWLVDVYANSAQSSTAGTPTQVGTQFTAPGAGPIAIQPYTKQTYTFTPTTTGTHYFGIRVNQASGTPWYIAFDNFRMEPTPTCLAPSAVAAGSPTASSLSVSWTANSSATQHQIEYKQGTSFAIGTGTRVGPTSVSNPTTITGLTSGMPYTFYVRDICGPGDTSFWSSPATAFTTFPAIPANDDCSTPVNISNGAVYYGSTSGATQTLAACDATTSTTDVWYTFTTGSAGGTINDTVNTTSSGVDVVVQMFSGPCTALIPMIPTAGTTFNTTNGCVDGPAAGIEWSTYTVAANTTYYIRVYTYAATPTGPFSIQIAGAPLAIKLDNITATNVGSTNKVVWNTLAEEKSDRFELQRSTDGKSFETIHAIGANGTPSRYTYDDRNAFQGANYYRLSMKEANGKQQYSKIVVATVNGKRFAVTAYPNPVSEDLTVIVSGTQGSQATILVTDVTGKTVLSKNMEGAVETLNMSGLANGIYLIKYVDSDRTETIRVTKQ